MDLAEMSYDIVHHPGEPNISSRGGEGGGQYHSFTCLKGVNGIPSLKTRFQNIKSVKLMHEQ